jgi:PIN domain nuclease of toxin-antitoxin system
MELAIKKNINKLPDFVPDVETVIDQFLSYGFELLQLTNEHIFTYKELPLYAEHKDPFDRFLIAVAMKENLTILTSDAKFQLYTSLIKVII